MIQTNEEIKALVERLFDRAKRMNGALAGMSDRGTYALGYYDQFAATDDRHAADALEALSARGQELRAENERLRSVVSKVCEALPNGAFCSPQCSIEFMENVPEEVAIVCKTAEKRLAEVGAENERNRQGFEFHAGLAEKKHARAEAAEAHRDRLVSALRPFADAAGSYDGESDEMLVSGASLRAKHLRAAREALSGSSDPRRDVEQ